MHVLRALERQLAKLSASIIVHERLCHALGIDLAAGDGCCGILMPRMEKEELFTSVLRSGPFPKKSFSIGLGADKRYYLECRKL